MDADENLFTCSYDSPIEEVIGEQMGKYFEHCKITPQYSVMTSHSSFVLDFLIEKYDKRIAIECDGRKFHEYVKDLYRDALLLGEKHINEMIRFRGKDIVLCPNLCMFYLAKTIPDLCDERIMGVLDQGARQDRWNINIKNDPDGRHFYDEIVWDDNADPLQDGIHIYDFDAKIIHRHWRFQKKRNGENILPNWADAILFMEEEKIKNIDEFSQKYHRQSDFPDSNECYL